MNPSWYIPSFLTFYLRNAYLCTLRYGLSFLKSLLFCFVIASPVIAQELGANKAEAGASTTWLNGALSSRFSMSGMMLSFGVKNALAQGLSMRYDIGFYPINHAEGTGFNLPVAGAVQTLELGASMLIRGVEEGSSPQLYTALGPKLFLGFGEAGMGASFGIGALGGFEWLLGSSKLFAEVEATLPFLQAPIGEGLGFSLNFIPRISLGMSVNL